MTTTTGCVGGSDAGSGNTFLTPSRLPPAGAATVTRSIRFVWVVKERASAKNWFKRQFEDVVRDVRRLQREGHDVAVEIQIYVTAADFTPPSPTLSSSSSSLTHSTITNEKSNSTDTTIQLLPDHPDIRNLIYETAETARGEMAVVVCGPASLVQSARNAAADVSVERGVHKGTGAQGIYVHAEAFGYV